MNVNVHVSRAVVAGLLGGLGALLCGVHSAEARPLRAETSAYGQFIVKPKGEDCSIHFKHASGKVTELFTSDGCDPEGTASLEGVEKIGTTAFPVKSAGGDEFHLFAISSARGGNACGGYDYFFVVVYADVAWAAGTGEGVCEDLAEAKIVESGKAALVAKVTPTALFEGAVYTVKLGKFEKKSIPKLEAIAKETKQITVVGELNEGAGFTNHKPYIAMPKGEALRIDNEGRCDLARMGTGKVELKAEQKVFADGSSEVTCQSISPVK